MKKNTNNYLFFLAGIAVASSVFFISEDSFNANLPKTDLEQWDVCFTPNKKCQNLILKLINSSQKSIHMQAYSFTDSDIFEALLRASKRGVEVQILLDKSNTSDKNSFLKKLKKNKISTRIDHLPGIAHNKVLIIDQQITVTGSYNFSNAAYKRNAENILFLTSSPP